MNTVVLETVETHHLTFGFILSTTSVPVCTTVSTHTLTMDIIEGELTCVICLSTLTEPHQYPCGHSYCLSCITGMRRLQDYQCPECRQVFPRNEDVIKNYRLANIAEAYKKSALSKVISQYEHKAAA